LTSEAEHDHIHAWPPIADIGQHGLSPPVLDQALGQILVGGDVAPDHLTCPGQRLAARRQAELAVRHAHDHLVAKPQIERLTHGDRDNDAPVGCDGAYGQ
jgi:hypothetical protein